MADNSILNNSYVVGIGGRNLVLNTFGRVYVKVQDKYYELDFKSQNKGKGGSEILIINSKNDIDTLSYPGDNNFILSKDGFIYYTEEGKFIPFEVNSDGINLVNPKIIGTITIDSGDNAPFVINTSTLVKNLNVEYLNGYSSEDFGVLSENELVTGQWTFTQDIFSQSRIFGNNAVLDFENGNLIVNNLTVKNGINAPGLDISYFEIDDNNHLYAKEGRGIYSDSFISCKGLDPLSFGTFGYATEAFVSQSIAELVGTAPETLDTLEEIANAINGNQGVLEFLTQSITNNTEAIAILNGYFTNGAANYAIQLKNSRYIWGQEFNGTSNVSGHMYNVGSINFSNGQILTPTVSGHLHLNEGFVSDKFISCKGLDASAGQSGSGGVTRANLFDILSSEPNEGESINLKYLDLTDYATINWVNTTFALKTALNDYVLKTTYDAAINSKTDKTITLTAGDGLTGGGTLEENRTFTLGIPSKITFETTNAVTSESHTHEIDQASTSVMGIVKLYDALNSDSTILALTAKQGKAIGTRLGSLEDMWENKDTYLLAKSDRGVVSNSFISCGGLDASAVQSGGTFDRGVLFDILSGDPQSGESINLEYLDLSKYDTELESINNGINTINGYFTNGAANKVKAVLKFGDKSYNGSSEQTIDASDLGLGNVENTKLSTWAGTSKITTLGTITTGTWNGTKIANAYLVNSSIKIAGTSVSLGSEITADTLKNNLGLGDLAYVDSLNTDEVSEGNTNKYFTNTRALEAITGAASTIKSNDLTANRALISNASGKVAVLDAVTSTELGYLDGVTSAIQTQFTDINDKIDNFIKLFEKLFSYGGTKENPTSIQAKLGLWTDFYLSCKGLDSAAGSASSNLDLDAMWSALFEDDSTKIIHSSHIPIISEDMLSDSVQTALNKSETDPIFTASVAYNIKASDITNWNSKTSNVGTITGIKMNGASKGTSGVVDLGTVITEQYSLPLAANGTRGGIQVGFTTNAVNRNYAVQLSGEKAYVNVPWSNTTYSAGDGIIIDNNVISLELSDQGGLIFDQGLAVGEILISNVYNLQDTLNGKQPLITANNKLAYSLISGTPTTLPASDVYAWAKKPSLAASDVPDLSGSYLSTGGGMITSYSVPLQLNRTNEFYTTIEYLKDGTVLGYLGFDRSGNGVISPNRATQSDYYTLIHSGNYTSTTDNRYLQLSGGGTLQGDIADLLVINRLSSTSTAYIAFKGNNSLRGRIGFNADGLPIVQVPSISSDNQLLIHSGNIGNQSVDAATRLARVGGVTDANTITFTDYSLRWYSAIANTATNLPSFSGYQNGLLALPLHSSGTTAQIYMTAGSNLYFRGHTGADWKTIAFTDSDITGNAATATKLASSVFIYGSLFDGTSNIGSTVYIEAEYGSNLLGSRSSEINRYNGTLYLQHQGSSSGYSNPTGNLVCCGKGGNVLIGTTADNGAKLQVNGGIRPSTTASYALGNASYTWTDVWCRNILNNTTDGFFIGSRSGVGATDGGALIYSYGNTPISFYTKSNERMRITGGGNVLIGTISDNGTAILQLKGNIHLGSGNDYEIGTGYTVSDERRFNKIVIGCNTTGIQYHSGRWTSSGTLIAHDFKVGINAHSALTILNNGTVNLGTLNTGAITAGGNISASGNITASGDIEAFNSSDARLKENITTIPDDRAIDILSRLNPVTFAWNEIATSLSSRLQGDSQGFIAQEWEKIIPNASGTMWGKYKGIDYIQTIPYLTKGWQIHETKIERLEREVKELKDKLAKYESIS